MKASLPAGAGSNPDVSLRSVSCPSAGNCSAVGSYRDSSGNTEGVLLTETSGVWAAGVQAGLPADAGTNPNLIFSSVSCPSAGNCTAVGRYQDNAGSQQGLLLTETSGVWATGVKASLPAGALSSPAVTLDAVSCPSAGNCSAVGNYLDTTGAQQVVLLTQSSGVWATGVKAGLPADAGTINNSLSSVSCPSAGNCTAVGRYGDSSGNTQGLRLTQTSGVWATGVKPALPAGAGSNQLVFLSSVSCPSVGNCSAVGIYNDAAGNQQGVLMTQTSGAWATGVKAGLPAGAGSNPNVFLRSVSCPSAGNCSAIGLYNDAAGNQQGVLMTETSGAWATGVKAGLPAGAGSNPLVFFGSVSCPSAGNCAAVGGYSDTSGNQQGVLLTESAGAWATGAKAGLPAAGSNPDAFVGSVSCPSAGNCSAVGSYTDSSGNVQGVLLGTAPPVSPTLSVRAAASATAGRPIAAAAISGVLAGGVAPVGTVTFTVFGPRSTPPVSCASGGIRVGTARVSGNGTYHPSAGFTPASAGSYWWFARYGGDASDNPAASACGAAMAKTAVVAAPPPPPPPPPALSAVNLGAKRFAARKGTKLRLTVSQAARIKVRITKTFKGRKVNGVCKRHATRGKRCTITRTMRRLTFTARAGANVFKLKLRRLAKGAYTATITADNANGKSPAIKRRFTITHK